ncbi:hypothetical protein ABH931_001117 [Streptacidiphilus sp. MAP12-33]|uniref:FUSC family protein n=1 Tax=Streptacidiphilus sp. MAP12-33 TaxID=3156266 RepID=UPI0035147FFF
MVRNVYQAALMLAAVLLSFATATVVAGLAGLPAPVLAVPGVVFAFMLSRRPGGEPWPEKAGAALLFTAAAAAGAWAGGELARHLVVGGAAFVALMGTSIWVRRFGPVATRLGAMAPLALIACLMASSGGPGGGSPWWTALVGLSAFCWVRAVRRIGARLTGLPGPAPRPASRPAARPAASTPRKARAGMLPSSRTALQMVIALTGAMAAGHLLFGDHWQWCVLSAMVVNLGTVGRGDLALKGAERGLGAMAGTLTAAALAAVTEPHGAVCVALIFLVLALASALRPYSYALHAAGITTALSLLYAYFGESPQQLLLVRVQALALGAAVAVAVGWFLLPLRTGDALRARMAAALAALSALLEARQGGTDTTRPLAHFDAALDAVAAGSRPHRIHRAGLRLVGARRDGRPTAAEVLLELRAPVRALTLRLPEPDEALAAATLGKVRRALADRPAARGRSPRPDVDAALRDLLAAIPAPRN